MPFKQKLREGAKNCKEFAKEFFLTVFVEPFRTRPGMSGKDARESDDKLNEQLKIVERTMSKEEFKKFLKQLGEDARIVEAMHSSAFVNCPDPDPDFYS